MGLISVRINVSIKLTRRLEMPCHSRREFCETSGFAAASPFLLNLPGPAGQDRRSSGW